MKTKPHIEVDIYIEYIGDNILIGPIGEETDAPAFAVFNANNLGKATKMCRLSFSAPKYIQHKEKYYCDDWIMSQEEKKELMSILQQKSDFQEYTIFESMFMNKIYSTADNWDDTMRIFNEKKKNLVMPDYTQLPEEST